MTGRATPPHRATLILLTAMSVLTLTMILPSLTAIAAEFEASYAVVSLAVAGFLAMTAIVHLIAGPLSDRYGRRPVLLCSLAVLVVVSVVCTLATNIWVLLFFRMLQAAMAVGGSLSMAIVRDTHEPKDAAGILGYIAMAMAVVPMLGPMFGGVLDSALGWRSIFLFFALAGATLFLLSYLDVGETRPEDVRAPKKGARRQVMSDPRFWAYSLCVAFSTGYFFIFLVGAPFVATATFGVSAANTGVYVGSITAGFMVGSFVAGRYAPRFALSTMMLAGRVLACTGLVAGLGFLAAGILSPLTFFGCTMLAGAGNGITMPSANTGVMSISRALTGTAAGLNAALNVACGAALTSLAGVLLSPEHAPRTLLLLMLASALVGLFMSLWARKLENRFEDAQNNSI